MSHLSYYAVCVCYIQFPRWADVASLFSRRYTPSTHSYKHQLLKIERLDINWEIRLFLSNWKKLCPDWFQPYPRDTSRETNKKRTQCSRFLGGLLLFACVYWQHVWWPWLLTYLIPEVTPRPHCDDERAKKFVSFKMKTTASYYGPAATARPPSPSHPKSIQNEALAKICCTVSGGWHA